MANINNNRINITIPEADITSVKTDIQHIISLLPEYGLTKAELKSMRGMTVGNKIFAEDCINQLRNNGAEIMPPYIKPEELIADFTLFEQLNSIKSLLKQALGRIEAAQRIAGKEAYDTALKVYELYETAAKSGVPGASSAFEVLSQRFKKSTGRKKEENIKKK